MIDGDRCWRVEVFDYVDGLHRCHQDGTIHRQVDLYGMSCRRRSGQSCGRDRGLRTYGLQWLVSSLANDLLDVAIDIKATYWQ